MDKTKKVTEYENTKKLMSKINLFLNIFKAESLVQTVGPS